VFVYWFNFFVVPFFRVVRILSILLLISLSVPKKTLSASFFDNFDGGLTKWNVENDGYTQSIWGGFIEGVYGWYSSDGKLWGEAGTNETSFISPMIDSISRDFEFSCKAVNYNGVDQSFWFQDINNAGNSYEVNYRYKEPDWPQDHNKISFRKTVNGVQVFFIQIPMGVNGLPDLLPDVEYKLKVTFIHGVVKIYLDSFLIYRYIDNSPISVGKIIFRNWGGHFYQGRVKNSFDNVYVGNVLNLDNTKVIILPGLGASWNVLGALGSQDASLEWQMPSFIKTYDNLKNEFIANGFEEGKNLFIWPYDWRQTVNQISANLDVFLSDTNITDSDDEIILIGHSLGGTVARWWYQNSYSDTRIKKVISLGSPHFGTVDAYEAWNGGKITGDGLSSIVFNILMLLNRDLTESPASVVQRIAPIVKDLQPVTDFTYIGDQLKDFSSLIETNSGLALKNAEFDDISMSNLYTIAGTGFETKEFLRLGERSFFDKRLDIWPDGHPIDTVYSTLGDNTVLSGSARLGLNYYELTSNHGDLVTGSINQIMSILGLEDKDITNVIYDNFKDSMIFYIASPAHLEVNCGTQTYSSDQYGFVVVKNDSSFSGCSVRVVADRDGGNYKLVVGSSGSNSWSVFSGQVLNGETNVYSFDKSGLLTKNDDIFVIFENYFKIC